MATCHTTTIPCSDGDGSDNEEGDPYAYVDDGGMVAAEMIIPEPEMPWRPQP